MAVIQRTECWGLSIRFFLSQGIILLMVLAGVMCNPLQSCNQAKKDIATAGFPESWVQDVSTSGGETCGKNSCCSMQAEQDMFKESKRQLNAFLRDALTKLSSLIDTRAKKFDGLFREMMNTSKYEFHEMFQKTYGKIYLQNSDVFSDFFKELETYYKKGSTRLSDTLENFFVILYQRMFTVINSNYSYDEKYMDCIADHMKDVKPFGDVPHKFTLQLKRSFIATRTYYKALATAAETVRKLLNVEIDKDCWKYIVQMQYCGSCNGLRGVGTCSDYCTTVLQTCLSNHLNFSASWDNLIDALDKVADRLVGPYNIEIVVEPLNIKISEAVMTFQENRVEVTTKILGLCGKPNPARRKRKTDYKDVEDNASYEIKYSPLKKINGQKKKKNKKLQEEEEDTRPSLERLIREIKTKVRDTRQFWANLPYQYCNNITAPPSASGECWNGSAIQEPHRVLKSSDSVSVIIKEQEVVLTTLFDQLRNAYNGQEVEFIDDYEDSLDGSGSGSGDFEIDSSENEERNNVEVPRIDDDFQVDNEVPRMQPPQSTATPGVSRTGGAATMSLNKALVQYLLPIVLVWFGGAISDLL